MIAARMLGSILVPAAMLVILLAVRTAQLESRQEPVTPIDVGPRAPDSLALHLAQAVRIPTVSGSGPEGFLALHRDLARWYPRVFSTLRRIREGGETRVPEEALLLEWPGRSASLEPILFLAHLDVVPVESETADAWSHPPYAGAIDGGYLWGRGSMDDKASVLAVLEAVESLLEEGFAPARGVFLGFGHDEEVGGAGAAAMARVLQARGVRLAYVLDEGLAITHGFIPGIEAPVALVGIAEKGAATVELVVETEGGHSSMPSRQSAPGLLAGAVAALEAHPMPARLDGATRRLFEFLAPEMRFPLDVVFANLWLLSPVVKRDLAASPATDAAIRTTTAITLLQSGIRENVLPGRARAVANFRILPGDDVDVVLRHVRSVVDTAQVQVRCLEGSRSPSRVSDAEGPAYRTVARTVRQVFPEVLVAPGLVLGGTDSRHFEPIAEATYRFAPFHFRPGDGERLHGVDERIPVEELPAMSAFYRQLILNSSEAFPE